MSNSGKFLSYGHIKDHDQDIKSQLIHHFFDYGQTGLGIGQSGHSEYSLCHKAKSANYHLYMQCLPIELIKQTIDIHAEEQKPFEDNFCNECCIKVRRYLKEYEV